jgi:hypothetical protein
MAQLDLETVVRQFDLTGNFVRAEPYGTGHINDTYAVWLDQGISQIRYIFQRINDKVFPNPPQVMENIVRVTSHVRSVLESEGVPDISRRTLTVVPTRDQQGYWKDSGEDGGFWRCYLFIENARSYDTIQDPRQAYEAAKAFGGFQRALVDLPGEPLHETIPDFHNGPKRFRDFEEALRADACGRAVTARNEIESMYRFGEIFEILPREVKLGRIPIRTTHNDTKINNVMIDDETGEGICVIDLDTLMPGLAPYDFGDMVRTSTCRAAEDERDLSKVSLDLQMFEQLARGYLSEAGYFLTESERHHLITGGKMITLIIGCRFLTDFLKGDVYFKVHREGHNLDRCRTQFRLVESILEQEGQMREIADKIP